MAVLGPYQVKGGPRVIFPSQHHVGEEFPHVEVGILERIAVLEGVLPDMVLAGAGVVIDFPARKFLEPVAVILCARVGDPLEGIVFCRRDKGLTPVLQRQVGGEVQVDAEGGADGILADGAEKVPVGLAELRVVTYISSQRS